MEGEMRRATSWALKLVILLGLELLWLYPASAYNVPGSQNLLIRPTTRASVNIHTDLVRSCLPLTDVQGNKPKISLVGQGTTVHGGSGSTDYRYTLETALLCVTSPEFQSPFGATHVGA